MEKPEADEIAQQVAKLEQLVRPHMTKEAFGRYSTVRMVHPDRAVQALATIGQSLDKFRKPIDDKTFKEVLRTITPKSPDFNITRK